MAFPLCSVNYIMLSVIWLDHSLLIPMFYFLSTLALADLGLSVSTLPTMLSNFCLDSSSIHFNACVTQMYFIQPSPPRSLGSWVAKGFDCFVAICNPPRYASVLTNARSTKAGAAILLRAVCVMLPVVFLIKRLPFCLHSDVRRLAHGDKTGQQVNLYGLTATVLTKGLDSLSIHPSYVMILKAVLSTASWEEHLKAFSTCISHTCCTIYIPLIGLSVLHRFGRHLSHLTQTLLADAYLLVPLFPTAS
ncbi:olfactory receptor 51L1-like [Emys orbicularis]|uniref:olfactory receptor 51L1-like n=1 Tax=Emys orbicularis TaxID=82168 RepID=UPI0031FCEDBE